MQLGEKNGKRANYAHDTHLQKPLIIVSLAHISSSFSIERWIFKRERQKKAKKMKRKTL